MDIKMTYDYLEAAYLEVKERGKRADMAHLLGKLPLLSHVFVILILECSNQTALSSSPVQ